MTTDGTYAGLTGRGREVALTDPNSIKNTSVRPHSIETGVRPWAAERQRAGSYSNVAVERAAASCESPSTRSR
ncbi:uncharacterized protein SOCEGT47_027930 [Sorangium cellulosum]|uniref:Uncharacterized protein n=1 Tax=Sorangium cellulosum TaxID=56 RepID=A0A4V0NDD5_SORCE|nr:uncharacterized protein SOCEGT47_027930 [Sorangium cellulosum]